MRSVIVTACGVLVAAGCWSSAAIAQALPPGLANLKIVQPDPERPGDGALSCAQISQEMSAIMQKRNLQQVAHTSKDQICRGKKVLDRQSAEKQKLAASQTPALVAASLAPSPATNVIVAKVNAENMALEQRQQPARQEATAEMMSGVGGMMGLFNDGRLMRLSLLAQEHQCAQNAPRPPPREPADSCENADEPHPTPAVARPPGKESSGPADPFGLKGKAAPAASPVGGADPFAKAPDPFTRR
jgi:phenylpyruvate tautomerase PptA (4-oxalocrotonate tautomerase family)